jgi:hypothetical protein
MRYALTIGMAAFLASVAFAGDESRNTPPPKTAHPATRDVCDHKSRDWSAMRETLVALSRFRGKNEADVQKIARKALTGSRQFSIGEFELSYARGRSGSPLPNDTVCFPKEATFSAIRNNGNDAAYECKATLDVKGTVLSISCKLVAG